MDETPFLELVPLGWDVLFLYDFRNLKPPVFPDDYKETKILAWSFGVVAALSVREELKGPLLCVAGTGAFYHAHFGIPPRLYDVTLKALKRDTEKTLNSFYQNMFTDKKDLNFFLSRRPQRCPSSLIEELESIKDKSYLPPNKKPLVLITHRDRIISARNQKKYWGKGPYIREGPFGHFPFYRFRNLEDLWYYASKALPESFKVDL